MASLMLNAKLNKYFADKVQMSRDETSRIVTDVMPDIEDVVKCISDLDRRFGSEAHRIGSYYQGLKVKQADEFDLSIALQFIENLRWCSGTPCKFGFNNPDYNYTPTMNQELTIVQSRTALQNPGKEYKTLNLGDTTAASKYRDLMFDTFLIPFSVKLRMKAMLFQALSELQLRGRIKVDRIAHGPALTLRIAFRKSATETITVNVDFAAIICAKLPFSGYTDWADRARRAGWPSWNKINEIETKGINVVAKQNFFWQVSFAECEKFLVHDMDADGGIRKKVHRIIKSLYKEVCKGNEHPELSSYMLKNAWLLECERCSDSTRWAPDRISERVLVCIQSLERAILCGELPQYFCRDVNLFRGKDLQKIEQLLDKLNMQIDQLSSSA